ncbi:MAG: hypothetical protein ACLSAM_14375, partial [Alistipes onderdonkii]
MGGQARQVGLTKERDQVAEMHVRGVERIQRAERITPPGRNVAVRHAHLVGITEPEREFVQSLAEADALDIGDLPAIPFDLVEV